MPLKCQCNIKECIGGIVYYIKQNEKNTSNFSSTEFAPLSLKKCQFDSKEKMSEKEDAITQYYENDENVDVDARYALPIKDSVEAIVFEAEFGGKRLRDVIKDATGCCNGVTKATNGILPNYQAKPKMYQTNLGVLKPGASVKISLRYISDTQLTQTANGDYHGVTDSKSHHSVLSWDEISRAAMEEDDDEEHDRDDDGLIPWHDRPWGETGRNWGDFGRPWGVIKRPWGQYPFK